MDSHFRILQHDLDSKATDIEWNRYLTCSPLPSPKIIRDLNAHLKYFGDETLKYDEVPSLTTIYSKLPAAYDLLTILEKEMRDLEDKQDTLKAGMIHECMVELISILQKKWDSFTLAILQKVEMFARDSTENFHMEGQSNFVKFGLWSNLSKSPRNKILEFAECGMTCEVSKPLSLEDISIRMMLLSDPSCGAPYKIQDGSYTVLGPILLLDLLAMPEPSKKVGSWTMRPILSEGNSKSVEYPFKNGVQETENDEVGVANADIWSIECSYKLPDIKYLNADATVMVWEKDLGKWVEDYTSDFKYDRDSGTARFKTKRFAAHALVQDSYQEYPLQDWNLTPRGLNETVLSVTGKVNQIEILIKDGLCHVHGIIDDGCSPSMLLARLGRVGLNFLGPKDVNLTDMGDWIMKSGEPEIGCLKGISQNCHIYSFRRSPSNRKIGTKKCAFQYKTTNELSDWQSILYDSSYDGNIHVAIITPSNQISNTTRFNMDGNESQTVLSD